MKLLLNNEIKQISGGSSTAVMDFFKKANLCKNYIMCSYTKNGKLASGTLCPPTLKEAIKKSKQCTKNTDLSKNNGITTIKVPHDIWI